MWVSVGPHSSVHRLFRGCGKVSRRELLGSVGSLISWRGSCNSALRLPSCAPLPLPSSLAVTTRSFGRKGGSVGAAERKTPRSFSKMAGEMPARREQEPSASHSLHCWAGGEAMISLPSFLPSFFPHFFPSHTLGDIQEKKAYSERRKGTEPCFLEGAQGFSVIACSGKGESVCV